MATNEIATILLLGSFVVLIFMRVPIGFALGLSSILTTWYLDLPLMVVAQGIVRGIDVFVLLAVPFFIIAGEIMGAGGISARLVGLANALVGRFRGGLAMVNVLASMFFGGISGSSAADTSSIGSLLIPIMKKKGYDGDFATSVTMAGSVQGILIPPSHNMIIFALVAGSVSIGRLFLAGVVPGILLGVALMIFCYIMSVVRKYPVGEKVDFKTAMKSFWDSILGLATVLIVVVGVISGIFTATESAALAAVWAFFVTFFVYREIPLSRMNEILGNSLKILAIILIMIGTSSAFGWLTAYLRVPGLVAQSILGVTDNPILILLILNGIMLFLGMIMDMAAIILVATPVLLPIAIKIGIDPVHFGIIMMLNLGIGLITPPVGTTLNVICGVAKIKMDEVIVGVMPFLIAELVVLALLTLFPSLVLVPMRWFM